MQSNVRCVAVYIVTQNILNTDNSLMGFKCSDFRAIG